MNNNRICYYFGYGANALKYIMAAITGNPHLVGSPAVLYGYELCIQGFNQIPNVALPGFPEDLSPRKIIGKVWPPNFRSYVIRLAQEKSSVAGVVWYLTPEEYELVKNFELFGLGWLIDVEVVVTFPNGLTRKVKTDILGENQMVEKVVNGMSPAGLLNDADSSILIAEKVRLDYLSAK